MGQPFVHTLDGRRQIVSRGVLFGLPGSAATPPGSKIKLELLAGGRVADVALHERPVAASAQFRFSRLGAGHVRQDTRQPAPMDALCGSRLFLRVAGLRQQAARYLVQLFEFLHASPKGPQLLGNSLLSFAARHGFDHGREGARIAERFLSENRKVHRV